MVMTSAACPNLSPAAIDISPEEWRSVATQVESELHRSDTYRHAIAGLQTLLGEAAKSAQLLVQSVVRETIQLSFDRLRQHPEMKSATSPQIASGRKPRSAPPPPPPVPVSRFSHPPQTDTNQDILAASYEAMAAATAIDTSSVEIRDAEPTDSAPEAIDPPKSSQPKPNPRLPKLTKAQRAAQQAAQERIECLQQLGEEIRQSRQARGLSLDEVRNQTLIPLHLLQALENGETDKLPEDVYVRGFIRAAARILGLDSDRMLASLPTPEPKDYLIPSWHKNMSLEEGLSPLHLYLAYGTLITGAVGGLAYLTQQSPPDVPIRPLPEVSAPSSKTPASHSTAPVHTPAEIAPPEFSA